MSIQEKAEKFAKLHVKGQPLLLYNAWDAGSAKAIAAAGASAIATSSWAVAAAQGYEDGELLPIGLSEVVTERVVKSIDLPVTVDIEGGYAEDSELLVQNVARFLDLGVVGLNFEDRIVAGTGLYDMDHQAKRIAAIRSVADHRGLTLFLNARTDLFLSASQSHDALLEEAQRRAHAYAQAGASGFFVPGLSDPGLIEAICEQSPLPINVMIMPGVPSIGELKALGVARISFGPMSYIENMAGLSAAAREATQMIV
nr:isocitrate lyase/phosphoenolpyruvate mutase family protein [uncultured Shinella sp.]